MNKQCHPTTLDMIALNNQGADLLESGNIVLAIASFETLLGTARMLLNRHGKKESVICNGYVLDHLVVSGMSYEAGMEEGEDHCEPYFCKQPIRIQKSAADCCNSTETNSEPILAAAGIFNLALSFHVLYSSSQSYNKNNMDPLIKAVKLYEFAFELHNSASLWRNTACPSKSAFFRMAILNNLAHAHTVLGMTQVADDCYRQILSTLMFLIYNRQILHRIQGDDSADYYRVFFEQFFRSTQHLVFIGNSKGAAAA